MLLILVSSKPVFIDSLDSVVENCAEEEEQRILDTYERVPLHESDSEAGDTPDIPLISYLRCVFAFITPMFMHTKASS